MPDHEPPEPDPVVECKHVQPPEFHGGQTVPVAPHVCRDMQYGEVWEWNGREGDVRAIL